MTKFNYLPECLSEPTKAITNVEEIINSHRNSFQILENRAGTIEKRLEGVENTLKKIGEQIHKILKAASASMKALISKLENDHEDKASMSIIYVRCP